LQFGDAGVRRRLEDGFEQMAQPQQVLLAAEEPFEDVIHLGVNAGARRGGFSVVREDGARPARSFQQRRRSRAREYGQFGNRGIRGTIRESTMARFSVLKHGTI